MIRLLVVWMLTVPLTLWLAWALTPAYAAPVVWPWALWVAWTVGTPDGVKT